MATPTGAADSPPACAESAAANRDALKAFVLQTPRSALFGVNCGWASNQNSSTELDTVADRDVENRLLFLANMEGIKPPFHDRETVVCLSAIRGPEGIRGRFLRLPTYTAKIMLDRAESTSSPAIYDQFFATSVDHKIRVPVQTSDGQVRLHPFGLGLAPFAPMIRKMMRHATASHETDEFYKVVSFSALGSSRTWAQVKADPGYNRLQTLHSDQGLLLTLNEDRAEGPQKMDGGQ
mgnify:CR=1 FL=1|jgi:hypothetical protein